jgi:hypothetical protein
MEKTKPAVKRQLKEQWKKACNGFLTELLRMWEQDAYYGYWIGDEVGGVYDYGDGMFTISMTTSSTAFWATSPASSTSNGRSTSAMPPSLVSTRPT